MCWRRRIRWRCKAEVVSVDGRSEGSGGLIAEVRERRTGLQVLPRLKRLRRVRIEREGGSRSAFSC